MPNLALTHIHSNMSPDHKIDIAPNVHAADAGVKPTESPAAHIETMVEDNDGRDAVKWDILRQDAIAAEEAERHLSIRDSFKLYPKAIFWSFSVSVSRKQTLSMSS